MKESFSKSKQNRQDLLGDDHSEPSQEVRFAASGHMEPRNPGSAQERSKALGLGEKSGTGNQGLQLSSPPDDQLGCQSDWCHTNFTQRATEEVCSLDKSSSAHSYNQYLCISSDVHVLIH